MKFPVLATLFLISAHCNCFGQQANSATNKVEGNTNGSVYQAGGDIIFQAKRGSVTFASIVPAEKSSWIFCPERTKIAKEYQKALSENKRQPDFADQTLFIGKACIPSLFSMGGDVWLPDTESKNQDGGQAVDEPFFDVTLRNASDETVVFTEVGVEVLMAGIRHPIWGDGFGPIEIGVFKHFEVSFPKTVVDRRAKDSWEWHVWDFKSDPKECFTKLENPTALPPNHVMRYTIRLADFVWTVCAEHEIPANHAVVRMVVKAGDLGYIKSHLIYLNQWQ